MRPGDLPRSRSSALTGTVARALVVTGVGVAAVLGWRALHPGDEGVAAAAPPRAVEQPVVARAAPPAPPARAEAAPSPGPASPMPVSPAPSPPSPQPLRQASAEPVLAFAPSEPAHPPFPTPRRAPAPTVTGALAPVEPTAETKPVEVKAIEARSQPKAVAALDANPKPDAGPKPAGTGRIDLNTASLEALNGIPGAGRVGRAIVKGRPYASTEDLVRKRILNRSSFERIKDQVTVSR